MLIRTSAVRAVIVDRLAVLAAVVVAGLGLLVAPDLIRQQHHQVLELLAVENTQTQPQLAVARLEAPELPEVMAQHLAVAAVVVADVLEQMRVQVVWVRLARKCQLPQVER
mgnify:FL=1